MADIQMPQLGETVTEGTITRWFKQVGDTVAEDEPLFEVSTDKVDSEVPSPVAGTLSEILVAEGDTVDVGTVLARVGDGGGAPAAEAPAEAAPAEQAPPAEAAPAAQPTELATSGAAATADVAPTPDVGSQQPPAPAPTPAPASPAAEAPSPPSGGSDRLLSPVVRKLVKENNLDVSAITGTGPGGRITRDDVIDAIESGTGAPAAPTPAAPAPEAPAPAAEASAPAAPQAPAPAAAPAAKTAPTYVPPVGERDTAVPHSRIRRATAEHMRRSLDTSAHVYVSIEVDFEGVERVRQASKEGFKASEGFSLTYLPFISRAVVDAVREFPQVNASFGPDELVVHNYVNLGIAVDLDFQGLLVPVISGADGLRLRAIARAVSDLAARARSKKLSPDELGGGTFTITNPGPFGTTMTLPVINQPQVAILSTDGVKRRPVVVEDAAGHESIAIHSVGNITLTWDHRAFDGAYASAFVAKVRDIIETRDWAAELV